jgi:hypothetical protein
MGKQDLALTFALFLGPGVLQAYSSVEDQTARFRIGVDAKVAQSLELEAIA